MDWATLVGFFGGTALVLVTMQLAGELVMFWDFVSIIIVIGGSACATLMRWPIKNYMNGMTFGIQAVLNKVDKPQDLIEEIVELADTARKNSILALEKVPVANPYLAKCVKFAVDGHDPTIIDEVLAIDMATLHQRQKDGRAVFEHMGEACPAFGMIGTVVGLIVIMANLTDVDKIGPGLAVALITTLYGALMSNLVFIPLASKLKFRATEQAINMELIRKGVQSMLAGENPRTIREKLESFLQ